MKFVFTVFVFESRQLVRSRFLLSLCAFVLLAGLYGLQNGRALIRQQQAGIDSIGAVQEEHLRMLIARFHEDTATEKGKQLRKQAGVPQVVEFRHPPYTVFPPAGLAMMAIGLRDIHPYYDLVSSKENKGDHPAKEFANAAQLAAGNFDLAFVFLYLFPVLVILYCYNCLSGERELQTGPLLIIHTGGLQRLLFWRFVYRYVIVLLLGLVLFLAGGIGVEDFRWMALWACYWLFWFALCWLVMQLDRSSTWNVICLGSIWLLLVWILPACTNSFVVLKRPVPPKSGLLAALREVKEETWALPVTVLLDSFYHAHPQYISFRKSSDTAAYGNRRFLAFNELLGSRNRRLEQAYATQLQQHIALQQALLYINPVSYTQYYAHTMAGTEWVNMEAYQSQIAQFRQQYQALMREYLLHDRLFSEEDVRQLPRFSYQRPADNDILYNLFYLIVFSGIIIFPAQFKLK